ncbi:transmembrane 9 superfamily member 7-like [Rhododendron vialii]|uniref:transmembrane 9 superfamily member 7-like n=1 Tax=Rhododendron vialii TaxID=182163 RepID=UPI00265D813A|nr:transmembrane 9 superfamily member 7-like [Rhododendron vialii]
MKSSSSTLMAAIFFSLFLLLISSANSFCFYHPTVPRDFQTGDPLDVKVNKLSSEYTGLRYDYYDLRYCQPGQVKNNAETLLEILGEALRGDHIQNSMYTFNMREDQPCKVLCRIVLCAEAAKNFKEKIDGNYRVNLILDNLPVAVRQHSCNGGQSTTTYAQGFYVGFKGNYAGSDDLKHFVYNHLSFRVMFRKHLANDSAQIVGFEVTPYSINHEYEEFPHLRTCNKHTENLILGSAPAQEVDADKEIIFTYDVSFMESDIKWESRSDHLTKNVQSKPFSTRKSLMNVPS